jgi:hypothetical protein
MRFLIIKNVPGVKEMQNKIYAKIFNFPRFFAENPHSEINHYNNRLDFYDRLYKQVDNSFRFIENGDDTFELQEYKALTT